MISDAYCARRQPPPAAPERPLAAGATDEPSAGDRGIAVLPDRVELQDAPAALANEQRIMVLLHAVEGWEAPRSARIVERPLPAVTGLYYRGALSLLRTLAQREQPRGSAPSLRDWYV